jgi:hypothetical protein
MDKNLRNLFYVAIMGVTLLCGIRGVNAQTAAQSPQDGVQREYFDDGTLRLETRHKKGKLIRLRAFYRNGQNLTDYQYDKNGNPIRVRHYYDNGKLKSIWTKKSWTTKFYYPDGTFRVEVQSPGVEPPEYRSSYLFSGN